MTVKSVVCARTAVSTSKYGRSSVAAGVTEMSQDASFAVVWADAGQAIRTAMAIAAAPLLTWKEYGAERQSVGRRYR